MCTWRGGRNASSQARFEVCKEGMCASCDGALLKWANEYCQPEAKVLNGGSCIGIPSETAFTQIADRGLHCRRAKDTAMVGLHCQPWGIWIPMETSLGISMRLFPERLTRQRRPTLSVGKTI